MLLESVLAELSIDIFDDHQQQMLPLDTTPPLAAAQYAYNYTDTVVLEMCSPSESSSELLESSSNPITKHEEKEERQNDSSTRDMMHFSEDQENYNCSKAPGCVPFRWEIQPGVSKPFQIEGDLMDEDYQPSPAPLKLPPSAAAILPSFNSTSIASSASPKKNVGSCFSWNLSHLSTRSIIAPGEGFVQGSNFNGYDGDDDEDSDEEWSPVITLELPESPGSSSLIAEANSNSPAQLTPSSDDSHEAMPSGPARSACTTLLWGVFPCKCIFVPWFNRKRKKKQPEWATGHPGRQDSKVSSTSHGLKMILEATQSVQPTSALKKKSSCNRNCCGSIAGSIAGMKQVRFSVETEAYYTSSNEEEGTLPPPNLMDWASYGLF